MDLTKEGNCRILINYPNNQYLLSPFYSIHQEDLVTRMHFDKGMKRKMKEVFEKEKFVWDEGDVGEENENSILQLHVNPAIPAMDYIC